MIIDIGLFVLRIGLGIIFIIHGYPKLMGGTESWQWLGSQMSNLGIDIFPVFWGLMAALSECIGGALLTVGLFTRVSSFLLACVMLVALIYHLSKGDPFMQYSHPLSLLVVFISLIIMGPGLYAIDAFMQ